MVVLTIVAPSNPHTIYFDHPLRKPSYIRLGSCSLYNSWDNLKERGEITLITGPDRNTKVRRLLPGHYTLKRLANELQEAFTNEDVEIVTDTYTPLGQMIISKLSFSKEVKLDHDLTELFGLSSPKLLYTTFIKRLTSPTSYYIHCDLVDKEQNLMNATI